MVAETKTATSTVGRSSEAAPIVTEAALLYSMGAEAQFSVEQVTVAAPRGPEVRVRVVAAGLCHSDEHLRAGDYALSWAPAVGGHEGAGVVEAIGADVKDIQVGDHVVFSFIPSCGRCRECVTGRSNLCDLGAQLLTGVSIYEGRNPMTTSDGRGVGQFVQVGSFARYTVVHEASVVKIDPDIPLEKAALVGCGVATGWGSATNAAGTQVGDVAVVVGVGGVGINAVQGFRAAGASVIVAVDTEAWKGEIARNRFGATHSAMSMQEARELIADLTHGRMADRVVLTVGVAEGWMIEPAMDLLGRRGVMVFTAVAHANARDAKIDMFNLTHMERQLRGSLYGSCNPRADVPKLLENWRRGIVNLEDLITRTYSLENISQGYEDMLTGRNLRGVILMDQT